MQSTSRRRDQPPNAAGLSLTMTRDRLIREWPDGPNPYSSSDESLPGGQLVDEAAMLRAMDAWHAELARCTCSWDIDWEGRSVNKPPAEGCPVHGEEE